MPSAEMRLNTEKKRARTENHFAAVVIFINHVNLLRLRLAIHNLKDTPSERKRENARGGWRKKGEIINFFECDH